MKNLLLLTALATLLCCCNKDEDQPNKQAPANSKLIGDWSLVNKSIYATGTVKAGNVIQSDTVINYVTMQSNGVLAIDSESIVGIMSYMVDTTVKVFNYNNGILHDSLLTPYKINYASATSHRFYKMHTPDTINILYGVVVRGDTTLQTTPEDAVVAWSGDTLLLTTQADYTSSSDNSTYTSHIKQTLKYIRQK